MNKIEYLRGIYRAGKEIEDGKIMYTGLHKSGAIISVTYVDGGTADQVEVYQTNKIGVSQKIQTHLIKGRLCINRNNSQLQVNELIYQLDRVYRGLEVEEGEYNHFYPIAFGEEKISVKSGDIADKWQNTAHFVLCTKIKRDTGWKCEIPSYSPAVYSLQGKREIKEEDLLDLANKGLITMVEKE